MRHHSSKWIIVAAATTLCGSVAACAPEVAAPVRIEIAHELWAGFYPLDVASLTPSPTLELATVVEEDSDLLFARFAAGAHDAIAASLVDLLRLQQSVHAMRIVGCTDESSGADAVVARSATTGIADLKGKRIGVKPGTFSELLVSRMLSTAGLNTSDVTLVDVAARDVPHALAAGTIDAGETWEPYLSSLDTPAYRRLYSTSETPGLVIQCLAVREPLLRKHPAAVRELFQRVVDQGTAMMATPDSIVPRAARALKRDPATLPPVRGFRWLSLEDNRRLLGVGSEPSLLTSAAVHVKFLSDNGVLRAPTDLSALFTAEFLPK